jgi:hypothetical protein
MNDANNITNDTNNITNNINNKKVIINGINNRYQIKKLTTEKKEPKKRVMSEKWQLSKEHYNSDNQLQVLNNILYENETETNDYVIKLIKQQINSKIKGYKRQDVIRNILDETKFIHFKEIVTRLKEDELKCYYCKEQIFILYDMSREMKQWTVDRIDNTKGHNTDNFHIACLQCNLKRKRQNDDKFLYTKQLHIVKQDS